jgi:hypothetical protein
VGARDAAFSPALRSEHRHIVTSGVLDDDVLYAS